MLMPRGLPPAKDYVFQGSGLCVSGGPEITKACAHGQMGMDLSQKPKVQCKCCPQPRMMSTLPSTNMAPDRGSIQEEHHLPGTLPQVLCQWKGGYP